jgi:hypothetical protein
VTRFLSVLAASVLGAGTSGAFLALASGTALAQDRRGTAAATPPVAVVVELPPGSPLDERRIREAIARELGVLVLAERGAPGGTLVVRQEGDAVIVSFEGRGRSDSRTLALDAGSPNAEEEIAFVAGNVVRDQAAEFRSSPPPPAPPPPPPRPAAPAPTPVVESSPCARLAVSGAARTPLGVDFVPFVGTSSVDGGQSIRAVSIGALGARSNGIDGAAVSGLVNVDTGPACGLELAGLVNVAESVQGAQIGGIVNVAWHDARGLQVGLVDVAGGGMRGAQVGLVNTSAKSANVQIGLLNFANDADVQIGLVNVDLHGRLLVDAWTKPEAGTVLAGLKHGTAHTHAIYAFEMNVVTGRPWFVVGLGAHLTPSERVYVDIDALEHVEVPSSGAPNELHELRVALGYRLAPRLSVFAGPTFNVLEANDLPRADAPGYAWALGSSSNVAYRAWAGAVAGVEGL